MNYGLLDRLSEERIQKDFAHGQVTIALKNGSLEKEACFCGETKNIEAHHSDYNFPLEVIWCCKKHHVQLDRIKREQDLALKTGILID